MMLFIIPQNEVIKTSRGGIITTEWGKHHAPQKSSTAMLNEALLVRNVKTMAPSISFLR